MYDDKKEIFQIVFHFLVNLSIMINDIFKLQKNKVIIFSSIPTIASEKETIQTFLHRLGLDDKLDTFKEEDITLDLLLDLSENELAETLREMKLTIGKQMKIRKEINYMNSSK